MIFFREEIKELKELSALTGLGVKANTFRYDTVVYRYYSVAEGS